jgi:hypothetical protein
VNEYTIPDIFGAPLPGDGFDGDMLLDAPASEALVREHGTPPFPGAILSGDPPRWHNPHTGEDHPTAVDHPHEEHAGATTAHDAQPVEEKSHWQKIKGAVEARLAATAGGRAVLSMGRGGAWLFHQIEHRLLYAAKKTQEVAVEAARQSGLPDDKVPALKRALYVADFLGGYATGGAALAIAGPVAGKIAAIMPSASVAYLAYSTAKNPLATWRAARKVMTDTFARSARAHESADQGELAGALAHRLKSAVDPDWYLALFHAALAHAGGDVRAALDATDRAIAAQPNAPGEAE